jgi:hypothetical protein
MWRCHLQWHHLPTKLHKNPPVSSKVISGDTKTDRQAGDFTSLLSFLNKWKYAKNTQIWISTILNLLKLCDYKLSHWGSLQRHHLHTKFHWNEPSCSKDIHRSFIPKASNTFMSFFALHQNTCLGSHCYIS